MTVESPSVIFALPEAMGLAKQIATEACCDLGHYEQKLFPDGERYIRLLDSVSGRHIVCLGATANHESTLDLYDLASVVVAEGARRLSIAIPYFGYSTMERATRRGEAVVAKFRARLFSSIPNGVEQNQMLFFDLHSPGIPHYLENGVGSKHLRAHELLCEEIKRLGGQDFVLGSTDAGRAKWVETMANQMGVDAAFVLKRRRDDGHTEILALNARVEGRTVVLYDDMIRSGGTLISAARAYQEAGAARLFAVATHGVFTGESLDRIADTGLFERVICTDSHPKTRRLNHPLLSVVSCASVFADALKCP